MPFAPWCEAKPRAVNFPRTAQVVIGDVTRPDTLAAAVDGVDGIVFTIGSDGAGKVGAENVDYGGVRNVLNALVSRTARIALMTAIGITNRTGDYNRSTEAHDWKRRSERLVRASGLPYTIVRPGWFDYNGPDEHRLVLLQGDRRHAGGPSDGVIARPQLAEVLVRSLTSGQALEKTFELVATKGAVSDDFDALFATLEPDPKAVSMASGTWRTCRSTKSRHVCKAISMRFKLAAHAANRRSIFGRSPGIGGRGRRIPVA